MAKILFVDDEPLTLKLLSQAASITGHSPFTAVNSKEALRSASSNYPDLIFTDLNIGKDSGIELAASLRNNPKTKMIPIIILTAAQAYEFQEQAIRVGVDRYLPKPIKIQTLIEVIREYTEVRTY